MSRIKALAVLVSGIACGAVWAQAGQSYLTGLPIGTRRCPEDR